MGDEVITGVRAGADVLVAPQALEYRRLPGHFHVHGVDEVDVGTLARVIAAPEDGETDQFLSVDAQAAKDGRIEFAFGVIQRHF